MCGISGVIGKLKDDASRISLFRMMERLSHRGPDDSGTFIEDNICLGHTRLSIIDLTSGGHQPMVSSSGNLVIVFNGEIYNYQELKNYFAEYNFKSESDTEVLIAAYEKWGVRCLEHINGMFAFALWDKEKRELFIARDRLGVKPLYYYSDNTVFSFASEIRALVKSGIFSPKIDSVGLTEFLMYQTVHAPRTIVEQVKMLLPGHYLIVKDNAISMTRYWDIVPKQNHQNQVTSYSEACKNISQLIYDAVKIRMISDVELGAFLSGGIDSSAIVGIMSQIRPNKVKTFNISFGEIDYDESTYASIVAKHFNTNHHIIKISPQKFLALLPEALNAMDHPSGDGPNTYIISKKTKEEGISVALSGIGGDELFGGYKIFKYANNLNNISLLRHAPSAIRRGAGAFINKLRPGIAGLKIKEVLENEDLDLKSYYSVYRKVFSWKEIDQLLIKPASGFTHNIELHSTIPFMSQLSIMEIETYLQNTLLRDTDQMSMAHALEIREPFLDYRLVEYVLSLPDDFKKPATSKKLLIDSMNGTLPKTIYQRKKMGFTFPWDQWMRTELKDFVLSHLNSLRSRGIFNGNAIDSLVKRFYSGDSSVNWIRLWLLVVLENWLSNNISSYEE